MNAGLYGNRTPLSLSAYPRYFVLTSFLDTLISIRSYLVQTAALSR